MGYAVAAGLDAAVVGVGGLEDLQRLGRVSEEGRDLAQYRRPVGLEREQVVPAAVDDQPHRLSTWTWMASPVTSAPASVSVARSAPAAVISFSPGATARWPRLSRASVPKAVSTCRGERPAARSKERRKVLARDGQHARPVRAEIGQESGLNKVVRLLSGPVAAFGRRQAARQRATKAP